MNLKYLIRGCCRMQIRDCGHGHREMFRNSCENLILPGHYIYLLLFVSHSCIPLSNAKAVAEWEMRAFYVPINLKASELHVKADMMWDPSCELQPFHLHQRLLPMPMFCIFNFLSDI